MDTQKRLVLRYNPGQFSFSNMNPEATNAQAFQLAEALNTFQAEPAEQILLVTTTEF